MRATRLDVIGENYKSAIKSSEEAKARLDEANKHLNTTKKQIDELKKKLETLESLDRSKKEHEKLLQERNWAMVRFN